MTGASMLSYELAARLDAASERDNAIELRDALEAGQSIHHGRYLIHGVLGRGSFATVYDAEHVGLGRRVAIKVPRLRSDNMPSLHERFVREARTSVLVQHPNVLAIYDCGTLNDGTPFLVLERVNGDSLTTIIARGPVSFALAIELGQQLARALSALADVGIVHRDIKPDNVMLHRSKYGVMLVKLVDFGVAKRSKWQAPMSLTLQGELVGTPQYMAAEQLRGEEVDGRTDIYAVAAVLYEALTGQPPHESSNFSDYLVSALSTPVKPIRELRPDCPPELERIILRALERDRSLRHDTPEQLLEELDTCKVQLKLDHANTRAAAHAMAAELEDSTHDDQSAHGQLSEVVLSRALSLWRRAPIELTDSWEHRFLVARDRALALAHRGGAFTRRIAPSIPRISLLLCILLFSRSDLRSRAEEPRASTAIVSSGGDAQRSGPPPAPGAAEAPAERRARSEAPPAAVTPRDGRATGSMTVAEASPPRVAPSETLVRGIEPPAKFAAATSRSASRPATSARGRITPGSRAGEAQAATPPANEAVLLRPRAAPASEPRRAADPRAIASAAARARAEGPRASTSTDLHARGEEPRASSEPVASQLAQAMSAFVAGRLDEAKSRYQQVLRSEPNNPAALRGMGLVAARLGEKASARENLRRYLAVSPSAPDAAAIEARLATLSK